MMTDEILICYFERRAILIRLKNINRLIMEKKYYQENLWI